jgi:molecular chaperone DnaK
LTVVGIDLGTTTSSVAHQAGDGTIRLATLRDGSPRLRSVVALDGGRIVIGQEAQSLASLDPDSAFAFFKRRMGTDWEVPHAGRTWNASQLSAEVLKALVTDAAEHLGERAARAVVTIPAYFGDDARRATQEAGRLAGLDIVELLHEPTAACLAYEPDSDATLTQLVYDLGGGTFDVSVVRFSPAGAEVLATAGDDQLGGKDWDDALLGLIADRIEAKCGIDARDDGQLSTDLLERARDAKHALSRVHRTAVTVPIDGAMQRVEITRGEFEAVVSALYTRTEAVVAQVMEDIGGRSRLDAVLLVGGSTRMPRCREALVATTGLEPEPGSTPTPPCASARRSRRASTRPALVPRPAARWSGAGCAMSPRTRSASSSSPPTGRGTSTRS